MSVNTTITTYKPIPVNSVRQSLYLEMSDDATPFQPKSGFAYNTSGISIYYFKQHTAPVQVTPVELASVQAVWLSGGLIEVDASNCPGLFRLDLPNAAFAGDSKSGAVWLSIKATGYQPLSVQIPLIDNVQDSSPKGVVSTVPYATWKNQTVRTDN